MLEGIKARVSDALKPPLYWWTYSLYKHQVPWERPRFVSDQRKFALEFFEDWCRSEGLPFFENRVEKGERYGL